MYFRRVSNKLVCSFAVAFGSVAMHSGLDSSSYDFCLGQPATSTTRLKGGR